MIKSYEVSATGKSGRCFSTRSFTSLEAAKAYLALPGVAHGTVYVNCVGGLVIFNTDPDMAPEHGVAYYPGAE